MMVTGSSVCFKVEVCLSDSTWSGIVLSLSFRGFSVSLVSLTGGAVCLSTSKEVSGFLFSLSGSELEVF